jgi:hypothetical protein
MPKIKGAYASLLLRSDIKMNITFNIIRMLLNFRWTQFKEKKRYARFLLGSIICLNLAGSAYADEQPKPKVISSNWQNSLTRQQLSSSAIFDEKGTLWLAQVQDGHVLVRRSEDQGESFGDAVKVNALPEYISASGETRPKILIAKNGDIYISYTQSLDTPYAGNIRFSRSVDGGKTFSSPITVNDNLDPITHRFEAMGINQRGQIYLAWLDKRDAQAAIKKGEKYSGISVYYAMSDNGGKSFQANIKVADHSCECCRVTMAIDNTDTPVIVWRHIFGQNIRDHGMARLESRSKSSQLGEPNKAGNVQRVTFDNWHVEACPHHGPALSIANGVYHLAWFNHGVTRSGLFYSYSIDAGKTFSTPLNVGDSSRQAGHAAVIGVGKNIYLVWKEFDGEVSMINAMRSRDGGTSWGRVQTVAQTRDMSDHPLLISNKDQVYLSWSSLLEGHRLIALSKELQ